MFIQKSDVGLRLYFVSNIFNSGELFAKHKIVQQNPKNKTFIQTWFIHMKHKLEQELN